MNNRSAKGIRLYDLNDLIDTGNEGDFFWPEDRAGIYIVIPGGGVTFWTVTTPQENGAHWHWDGNLETPTLTPSLHLVGTWHGWLRNGELLSC